MISPRGITISVNYGSLLEITLIRNMRHLTECTVVTSLDDEQTADIARSVPDVRLVRTDAFTRHGARFNKGLAFEEGFDAMGRRGQILIWDADILFPETFPIDVMAPRNDTLYGARRRMLEDVSRWSPDLDWRLLPLARDGAPIGFFQLFHAEAQAIDGKPYWYDPSFAHAGGGDAYFVNLWPPTNRRTMPLDVLHLGPRDTNWFGTDPDGRRIMDSFVVRNGWTRSRRDIDHSQVDMLIDIKDRVEVPGYAPSGFELPFVKRAKQR